MAILPTTYTTMHKATIVFVVIFITFAIFILPPTTSIPNIPHLDKVFHFSFFTMLALFILKLLPSIPMHKLIITSFLFAISTESLQLLSETRTFDLLDMLANVLGVVVGWSVFFFQKNST